MTDDSRHPVADAIAGAEDLSAPEAGASPAPSDGDASEDGSQAGWNAGGQPPGGAGGEESEPHELWLANLPMTDMGNAERFLARYGRDFLYVPEWGWLAWDGKRWNDHEAEAMVQRAVHATIKAIAEEAHQVRLYAMVFETEDGKWPDINPVIDAKKGTTFADRLSGWCLASQSNAHITCMARLAQHYLTASPEKFDADAVAFNLANGTLRFAKAADSDYVSFHPHRRSDFITKISPAVYDRDAACPVYDKFLERVQPEPEARRHLHAWGGLSLTGLPLAKMAFWYGLGRNGKGTTAETWAHVAGDYAQSIPVESFLDQGRGKSAGQASPDIAKLIGVRLLRTSEPGRNAKFDEGLIKLLTGGDRISARHLNKEFFEFLPIFKLTMQGNHRPKIEGVDQGIWSRVFLVPWLVSIPEAEQDTQLPEKLRGEASGILNRLLDGLCDYLDHGLSPTDAIKAATAEYREESDPIGRFLAECTAPVAPAEDVRVPGKMIYELYEAWSKAQGERPWTPKSFSQGLRDHGILRLKSSGMFYRHLRLTRGAGEFEGQEIGLFKEDKR